MDIEIKRGDQFSLDVTRLDENGDPVNLTGMTITSQVKNPGFVASLTVAITNAALGQFTLSASAAATATWPPARLSGDVKYVAGGGIVRRSKTFTILVGKEITT